MPSDSGVTSSKQDVLDLALQHARLDGGADGDDFVRVDALVRLLAEQLFHDLLHLRHARHAADEHDLVDVGCLEAGVLDGLLARAFGARDQVIDEALQLGAGELQREMLGARGVSRDERQVDLGLRGARQLDLGLLGGLFQALEGELVVAQVDALLLLELVGEVVDELHVEVFAAEERVAVRRLYLEHAVADLEDGNIERAAAEVVDGDGLGLGLLVEAVGERRRGRLVDDAQYLQTRNLAGVLGRLALRVVEVSGDGDDGLGDGLAELGFGGLLHLLQDEG